MDGEEQLRRLTGVRSLFLDPKMGKQLRGIKAGMPVTMDSVINSAHKKRKSL